jgi:hypothetical protein
MARGDFDRSAPFQLGIVITIFVIAALVMVGTYFSRPPTPDFQRTSTGNVVSVIPKGDSVTFSLNGAAQPFHYPFQCGGAVDVAAALANAQRSGAPVHVQHRAEATHHKNLGLAYEVYAISVPGQYERSYEQCREHWIARSQQSGYENAGFFAGALLLALIAYAFGLWKR